MTDDRLRTEKNGEESLGQKGFNYCKYSFGSFSGKDYH